MLVICKASAGSGKTHKLTGEYLRMLFSGGTDRYKSILAVTFTNKATGEMKQRVLDELHSIASGEASPFLNDLMQTERFQDKSPEAAEQAVRKHAADLLSAILNDYSLFNISTIDRFFQQVLRAFAIETGHFSSYSVEINDNSVLTLAVDALMNSIDDNEELLIWLIDMSIEAVEDGRDWDSVPQLLQLGAELFREPFKLSVRRSGTELPGRDRIAECGEKMREIVKRFRDRRRQMGEEAFRIMDGYGLVPEDFKGGSRSFMNYFVKLRSGRYEAPSKTFAAAADGSGPESWYTSKTPDSKKDAISHAYSAGLCALVEEAADADSLREYFTAIEILRNLSVAGILSDIEAQVRSYCRQNNLVLLSDTPRFLADIIDGSDTPFIYEKVGGRIDNYLLDEFQDTSRMQWDNFEPLVRDSVDAARPCLIVGDVKQSIYRWRGSDWRLLDSVINSRFDSRKVKEETLGFNWRSSAEVVEFNNSFFSAIGSLTGEDLLDRIYSDAVQRIPGGRKRPEGHVRITFAEGDRSIMAGEEWMSGIDDALHHLEEAGYRPGDIAFLVRTKAEGTAISDWLISRGFNIMTEDSLKISSSPRVRRAVEALRRSLNRSPEEQPRGESLYNVCEEIFRTDEGEEGGTAFISAFMDCVLEYIGLQGSDISGFLRWWDTEGSGRSVSVPEGRDAMRIITIHKSKGLEFKVVIIPYFQIPFGSSGNDRYLWCSSRISPFDALPVYPLEFRKSLEQTVFAEEYRQEKLYSMVDAVNLAYVAFTRAVQELVVFANVRSDSVSGLLHGFLADRIEDGVYESGTWTVPFRGNEDMDARSGESMTGFPSVPIGTRLRLSLPSEEFFSEDNMRMKGIVLHDILSQVEVAGDLGKAVRSAVLQGLLPDRESAGVERVLESMIESVGARHWFDGSYSLMTEVPILAPGGENYRPDRIMYRGTAEAVVVDYKFGRRREKEHRRQVTGYVELLKAMRFGSVKGYLWYGEEGVEEVV